MEIEIYSRSAKLFEADFFHNITKRERKPVSRTADANFAFASTDCNCGLVLDYHCMGFMKVNHKQFAFKDAIKHISYRTFDSIEITSQFMINIGDGNLHEFMNTNHIPFALEVILPTQSYDDLTYDVYKLLEDAVETEDLSEIDPNTYFYDVILPKSGFTEILRDCSPKIIHTILNSTIKFDHYVQIKTPVVYKVQVSSKISLIETLKEI